MYIRFADVSLNAGLSALVFGLAVVGGAFLLSWVAEVAELDIPHSLAISVLAIIAVLPEYAIDVYLAWSAADGPENVHLATANMTGSNRLLIGIGWSFVVLLFWLRTRQRVLQVPRSHS
ncbi:MAG: sodium:calcium antiporter, partial [Dehalococcoidia bacterium]